MLGEIFVNLVMYLALLDTYRKPYAKPIPIDAYESAMEQEKFSEETIVEVRHNFYSNKKEWMELGNRVTYTFKPTNF